MLGTIPYADNVSLYDATRLKRGRLGTMTKPTGGGTTQLQLNPTGLLRGVHLIIAVTVTGTPDAANALGMCAAIRGARLRTNSSTMIYDTSGAGYTYGVNEWLNSEYFVGLGTTLNQGASAVAAGSFNLDMYLPVAMNWRDSIGLFLLQNREINVQVEIDWEADTVLTGGATATYTGTCLVIPEWFTVPEDPRLLPPLNLIHQITEETRVISGSGDINYQPLTGQIYLGIAYGAYWAQSAADSWNRFQEIVGASDYWQDENVASMNGQHYLQRGRARRAGTIIRDFMATAGMGMLSQTDRDVFDTLNVTNFQHVITATGAGTLRIVRRQLVRVNMN